MMILTTFIYKFYFFLFMKRGLLLIGLLVLFSFLIACAPSTPKTTEETATEEIPSNSGNTVTITADGFSPKTVTVKAGTTVTFVNEDSNQHWPASAVHPTHEAYPDSGIKKCGTGELIFDACAGLAQGESFSFTFNEKGSWNYHDHLRPTNRGTIVVE